MRPWQWYGATLFAIDFKEGAVSIAAFMRAPLCVANERRQQMAGLTQAHPRVRAEGFIPALERFDLRNSDYD